MESTENVTQLPLGNITRMPLPLWEAVITGVALSSITLITITGNILVIMSIFTYKPLRIPPNYFIASLAVTDILVALTVFPFSMLESVNGRWVFGATFCKVWLVLGILCCSASIFHLCAIAMDRYWAISDPLSYMVKRTPQRILASIGFIWCISIAFSSSLLFGAEESSELIERLSACLLKTFNNLVVSVIIGFFYVVLSIMTIVYARLFFTVRYSLRHGPAVWGKETRSSVTVSTAKPSHSTGGEQSDVVANEDQRQVGRTREISNNMTGTYQPESKIWLGSRSNIPLTRGDGREKKWELSSAESGSVQYNPSFKEDSDSDYEDVVKDHNVGSRKEKGSNSELSSTTDELGKSASKAKSPNRKHKAQEITDKNQRLFQTRERKLARTLVLVMGAFILCWLPFFIMYVVIVFCNSCQPSIKWRKVIIWMTYINSTLNPIIYTGFNSEFRTAFKKILHL